MMQHHHELLSGLNCIYSRGRLCANKVKQRNGGRASGKIGGRWNFPKNSWRFFVRFRIFQTARGPPLSNHDCHRLARSPRMSSKTFLMFARPKSFFLSWLRDGPASACSVCRQKKDPRENRNRNWHSKTRRGGTQPIVYITCQSAIFDRIKIFFAIDCLRRREPASAYIGVHQQTRDREREALIHKREMGREEESEIERKPRRDALKSLFHKKSRTMETTAPPCRSM